MKQLRLRNFYNALATRVITAGGFMLIVIILGIMGFILYQTLPLWYPAEVAKIQTIDPASFMPGRPVILAGEDEQKELLYVIDDQASVYFVSLKDRQLLKKMDLSGLTGKRITASAVSFASNKIALGTDRGEVRQIEIKFQTLFEKSGRRVVPEIIEGETIQFDSLRRPIVRLVYGHNGDQPVIAGIVAGDSSRVMTASYDEGFHRSSIGPTDAPIVSMTFNAHQNDLMIGLANGQIQRWHLKERPALVERIQAAEGDGQAVTAMSYLIGDATLIVGDDRGRVGGWMDVKNPDGNVTLKKIRNFSDHQKAISCITPSWRNKSFAVTDHGGMAKLYHSTSEQLLAEVPVGATPLVFAAYSPKGDGLLVVSADGKIHDYHLDNPHPESTLKTLFGKVWYESYPKPSYTWQSTGGTDDFEPKMSLIPLIFGTLKATIYAMLFAAPLAILGALYTSQFAHPKIRNIIKPTVEIMAALPSVVIGFIAGLWLAPIVKDVIVEFLVVMLLLPAFIVLFVYTFDKLPKKLTNPFRHGYEVFLMIPVVIISIIACYYIGYAVKEMFFDGDVQHWLYTAMDIRYDQRNSIVVGVAMAFAVMPIIFTITEDSLASVPAHLTSASLALGASRWQTAVKVILPAASAGIFSAVMIGFGRAVGETMIVLMATGNTPIMDWSIFNGMRTLSANIAVEIPEAPHGGTLYRTLFLSGLLLFVMTFVVNTAAELVRQRLRKKYASM